MISSNIKPLHSPSRVHFYKILNWIKYFWFHGPNKMKAMLFSTLNEELLPTPPPQTDILGLVWKRVCKERVWCICCINDCLQPQSVTTDHISLSLGEMWRKSVDFTLRPWLSFKIHFYKYLSGFCMEETVSSTGAGKGEIMIGMLWLRNLIFYKTTTKSVSVANVSFTHSIYLVLRLLKKG